MDTQEVKGSYTLTASADELAKLVALGMVSPEGIVFHEELAGPEGMGFVLFPATHHTPEDIQATKDWLVTSRDVVYILMGKPVGEYPLPKSPPIWTPEQREAAFRGIVAQRSHALVEDCVFVDLFTASYMVQVLDSLSPGNRARMLSFPASRMIDLMWRLLERVT